MITDQDSILIKDCLVLQTKDKPNDYIFEKLDVLIDEGKVVSVGDVVTQSNKVKVIDGGNKHILIPVFVDNHIHSRMVGKTKNFQWGNRALLPKNQHECRELLEAAYLQAASAGTGILMDYPEYIFDPDPDKDGFNLPFECMKELGLTGIVRILLNYDKPMKSGYDKADDTSILLNIDIAKIKKILEEQEGFKLAIWIPEEDKLNSIDDFSDPAKPKYGIDKIISYLQGLYSAFSNDERVYFAMHCAEDEERTLWIRDFGYRNGIDFLQKSNLLGEKTVLVHVRYEIDEVDIQTVKDTGSRVVVRPRAKEYSGIVHRCPVRQFLDSGVAVGLGTDVPTEERGFRVISEIQEAMNIYGIDFRTAFYMATEMGAGIFGFNNTGRIQTGYTANLLMIDTGQVLDQNYSIEDLERRITSDSINHTFSGFHRIRG